MHVTACVFSWTTLHDDHQTIGYILVLIALDVSLDGIPLCFKFGLLKKNK